MPRRRRIVIPDLPHHITQRGNYRQVIFQEPEDFKKYCHWINHYAKKYALDILAYCLMNNHVHFIAIPRRKDSLALTFNTAHMRYAQYINKRKLLNGHLWQGRFFSCILQGNYLYRAIRYVEQNPVRASIVKRAWDYAWSSARWHVGLEMHPRINLTNSHLIDKNAWRKYLEEDDQRIQEEIKIKTRRGLVVGEKEFIASLEKDLRMSLKCLPRGRPRKQKKGAVPF